VEEGGESGGGVVVQPANCPDIACPDFCTNEWPNIKDFTPAPTAGGEVEEGGRVRRKVLAVDELWEDEDAEEWDEPELLLDEPVRRQLPVELPQGTQAKRESHGHTYVHGCV
jgi:hypothetical protein